MESTRANWHIHTNFSGCAQKTMTVENIVRAAEMLDLKLIALTDHYYNDRILNNIAYLKNRLKKIKPKLKVIVGAELSNYGLNKYGDSEELNRKIEYRLYACNHYHLKFWEHPRDQSPRGYAEHSLKLIENLIKSGRADCIAHPFVHENLKNKFKDIACISREIKDEELKHLFRLGKVAWELNEKMIDLDPGFMKRFYQIGRDLKAEFRVGTDAHRLSDIETYTLNKKLLDLAD